MATPNFGRAVQDMPPAGGFKAPNFARAVPVTRGPPGWAMFAGCAAIVTFGFYVVGQTNQEIRAMRKEQRERRVAMLPFLQAEEDAEYLHIEAHYLDQEKERMKNVPGWKVGESPYHSNTWKVPVWAQK
ncbi:hypothetical protein SDRG_10243 [Saprolegnia diclina VS20]|uniref:NADH dehydrogenase [ubiquinone] 1 alpha subcomplex subunit 13 n=1 Tax=Saprolegnia diclina (strain VS20) TaxID=1156394 RepID=T0QEP9_SAPDV|nr:hypothetical protein SDRG_10243 [Saprolegnia diclina VS20]EQC32045.1 hypothetical protein SDRG_10243 [Saprolegnia diclina VS20]|eukprot:XP_008614447.1 hypothetical protein SDRG_10243 [Saprolegnia diclina VS20]